MLRVVKSKSDRAEALKVIIFQIDKLTEHSGEYLRGDNTS